MARIRMTATKTVDMGRAHLTLRGGQYYLLSEKMAARLVDERVAYPEGEPPQCDICGRMFEGLGAHEARDRDRASHGEKIALDWAPGEAEPPPVDGKHPEVAALMEETREELWSRAHALGIADADVVATGSSGVVKEDLVRHILRAKGRRGFYSAPEEEDGS